MFVPHGLQVETGILGSEFTLVKPVMLIYGGLSAESFHYFCNSKNFHTMNYPGTPSFAPYHQLRKEIDELCDSLEKNIING